jgi:hypothetical protein
MARSRELPRYPVNGWTIEKCPNSFASRFAYEAVAIDAEGYQTARVGFQTLKAAREHCVNNAPPA